MRVCSVVSHSAVPWTVVCHVPLSMEFSRQKYQSGLLFPNPGDLRNRGRTCVSYVSCLGRRILYHCTIWEAKILLFPFKRGTRGSERLGNLSKVSSLHPQPCVLPTCEKEYKSIRRSPKRGVGRPGVSIQLPLINHVTVCESWVSVSSAIK